MRANTSIYCIKHSVASRDLGNKISPLKKMTKPRIKRMGAFCLRVLSLGFLCTEAKAVPTFLGIFQSQTQVYFGDGQWHCHTQKTVDLKAELGKDTF